jgi:hypothetical protein
MSMGMKSPAQLSIGSILYHDILPMSARLIAGYRLMQRKALQSKTKG